jgi:predicted transcriptional regulator
MSEHRFVDMETGEILGKREYRKKFAQATQRADMKARQRDIELEIQKREQQEKRQGMTQEEINQTLENVNKLHQNKYIIWKRKTKQQKARFAQILQLNWLYLNKEKYLTNAEKSFLLDLIPYVGLNSNAVVDNIKRKSPMPVNQRQLAEMLGVSETNINPKIKSLVKKGIISRGESGIEDNNATAYALFINPNIIYSGIKDKVNDTLKALFHKPMKMKVLKDLPEKLF